MMPQPAIAQDLFPVVPLTRGEIEAYRRKPGITPSQWAEQNYRVLSGPYKGRWVNDTTPYLPEILDTAAQPHVRQVVVVGPTQGGKTQVLYILWGFMADIREVNLAMHILADEITARRVGSRVFCPLARKCPPLKKILTGSPRDLGSTEIKLAGHTLYMAWPSEAQLETHSAELVELDEVDAYRARKTGDRLSDPIARAMGRAESFKHTAKIIAVSKCSTEAGPIWRELMKCQVAMVYGAVCPACGRWQIMRREQLKWDSALDDDPGRVEAENLCWYECENPDCPSPAWGERERKQAGLAGSYRPQRWDTKSGWWLPVDDAPARPVSVAFQFSQFYAFSFVPLGRIAAACIRAREDDGAEHDLCNKRLAIPYRHVAVSRDVEQILAHMDDRPRDLVPTGTMCLLMTTDTQDAGDHWYTIRAWMWPRITYLTGPDGEKFAQVTLDSYLVACGYLENVAAMLAKTYAEYFDIQGNKFEITKNGIDTGGHRTKEIYELCRTRPGKFMALKGSPRAIPSLFRMSLIEHYPGNKKPIPAGCGSTAWTPRHSRTTWPGGWPSRPASPGPGPCTGRVRIKNGCPPSNSTPPT